MRLFSATLIVMTIIICDFFADANLVTMTHSVHSQWDIAASVALIAFVLLFLEDDDA